MDHHHQLIVWFGLFTEHINQYNIHIQIVFTSSELYTVWDKIWGTDNSSWLHVKKCIHNRYEHQVELERWLGVALWVKPLSQTDDCTGLVAASFWGQQGYVCEPVLRCCLSPSRRPGPVEDRIKHLVAVWRATIFVWKMKSTLNIQIFQRFFKSIARPIHHNVTDSFRSGPHAQGGSKGPRARCSLKK